MTETFPLSDQMVWDMYYSHLATQGVMKNRDVAEWYTQLESTAKERRERPPEPAAGQRRAKRGKKA